MDDTWPDIHFNQYIKAYPLCNDMVPQRINWCHIKLTQYQQLLSYNDPVHSFITLYAQLSQLKTAIMPFVNNDYKWL